MTESRHQSGPWNTKISKMIYFKETKPPWQCWLGQCLLTIGKKRQVWKVDSLSLRDVQASWAENHLEKKLASFKVSVRWYKTCRKLRSSATLPLEASLSAVLSCFDPDWRYRLTAVEMSPSANLIWEEYVWQSFSCIWTKNTCFMFLPEISCQLEQVKFLEGKCLADCVRLLQLTLGASILFISSLEKEEKRKSFDCLDIALTPAWQSPEISRLGSGPF